jgi:AraC-like DNA-binding protein
VVAYARSATRDASARLEPLAVRRSAGARDAMDRDYAKPLDIGTLARIAIVSEAHFIRVFKDMFGEHMDRSQAL